MTNVLLRPKRLMALAGAIILSAALVAPAQASCVPTTPEQQAADARFIATGTIISLEPLSDAGTEVAADIDWVYKGPSQRDVKFRIASGLAQATSIDVPLRVGGRYLLYLVAEGGPLATHSCAGTREIAGEERPEVLGAGPGYGPSASPEREIEVPPYIPALGMVVSVALLLGAFVLARKIGRRPPVNHG